MYICTIVSWFFEYMLLEYCCEYIYIDMSYDFFYWVNDKYLFIDVMDILFDKVLI